MSTMYGMDAALSLPGASDAEYIACNFTDLKTGKLVADAYSIVTTVD